MLCLLIILERARGTASKWHPYINILPTRYGAPTQWHGVRCHILLEFGVCPPVIDRDK